jgi:hypothetical protein
MKFEEHSELYKYILGANLEAYEWNAACKAERAQRAEGGDVYEADQAYLRRMESGL